MAKVNVKKEVIPNYTHGGAKANHISKLQELERSVMSCMLWENEFYEDGETISSRIIRLANECEMEKVAELAIRARSRGNLRHVPLLLARVLAKRGYTRVDDLLFTVIQRVDEIPEFIAIYMKNGKEMLSSKVKKGLSRAFGKFNEYNFGKYKSKNATFTLRDAIRMVHPKPMSEERNLLYRKIAGGFCTCGQRINKHDTSHKPVELKLAVPDTWETELSAGKDKRETFTRLISENKLGALAMLRNLRGMEEAGVSNETIKLGLKEMKTERVLPFRFLTASRYAPRFEAELETAMLKNLAGNEKLKGKTVLIVDMSGSMTNRTSGKSELTRLESAFALSVIIKEICEEVVIYATAGNDHTRIHATTLVPSRSGFGLVDAFNGKQDEIGGGGIFLKQVMDYTFEKEKTADRVIVITDEQDCDNISPDTAHAYGVKNYIVNIASNRNGIAYSKFTHVNGFSEATVDFIVSLENSLN